MELDYHCVECENNFKTASLLLKHFAEHVISTELCQNILDKTVYLDTRSIPDLFPINLEICRNQIDSDPSSDSGVEDVNPIKFCLVTLEGNSLPRNSTKKFLCSYCQKRFSWSTDLKRHILTHTGERPFLCSFCNMSFTRKFLLQKHERKVHHKEKIPDLKPIHKVKKKS